MPAKKDETKKKEKAAETKAKDAQAEEPMVEKETEEKKAEKAAAAKKKSSSADGGNVEKIVEMVEKMTVLELSELVKILEDRFGVTAAAPLAMMPGMMPGMAAAAEEAEEKTEFDVVLKEFGSQKIQVIKVVRALTGLGLIEAKKMVEEVPSAIKEAVNKEEAENIKSQLEEVGATVEIK